MNCDELNEPILLPAYFKNMDESTLSLLFECLYKSHYKVFSRIGHKMCVGRFCPEYKKEDIVHNAFTEAVLVLYNKLKKEGWDDKGVALGAAFLVFYKFTVRNLLQQMERVDAHDRGYIRYASISNMSGTESISVDKDDNESLLSEREKILRDAFKELGERGANLIKWRKIGKLSNEVIAEKLNIRPGSVNNEVYKANERLIKIVERLKK